MSKTYPCRQCNMDEGSPFVENAKAVLIHRPRKVSMYHLWKLPHIAIDHGCGIGERKA